MEELLAGAPSRRRFVWKGTPRSRGGEGSASATRRVAPRHGPSRGRPVVGDVPLVASAFRGTGQDPSTRSAAASDLVDVEGRRLARPAPTALQLAAVGRVPTVAERRPWVVGDHDQPPPGPLARGQLLRCLPAARGAGSSEPGG